VTVASFLRNIYNAVHHPAQPSAEDNGSAMPKYTGIPLAKFRKMLEEKMALLYGSGVPRRQTASPAARRSAWDAADVGRPRDGDPRRDRSGLDIDAHRGGASTPPSRRRWGAHDHHCQRMLNYVKQFVRPARRPDRDVRRRGFNHR
jgi:hypothetical protein